MASAVPENRASFAVGEVAELTRGVLRGAPDARIEGVATDTRASLSGKLFVALSGDRFDGHTFASAAIRAGARALLVERDVGELGVPVIRVESTYAAFGALGAAQRRRWGGRLCAVAGSAGKTTTRSAIAAMLAALDADGLHFAPGNLNNRVGVPSVLLGLEPRHTSCVLEIGTNARGEVAELAALAAPDLGVLTLVGIEHSEGLGTIDEIEVEEGSLFAALTANGIAIGNADDARVLRQLRQAPALRRIGYGFAASAEYRVIERSQFGSGAARLSLARPGASPLALESALLGRAGALALAAGVAAAEACSGRSLSAEQAARACAALGAGEPGRLSAVPLGNGALILDDSYNSNPASLESSVRAALELATARQGQLKLVLGEMRELGEHSPALHREAATAIADVGARWVLGVGGDARWLLEPFAERGVPTRFSDDAESALSVLGETLTSDDVVLIKASRGVRAERIVAGLVARYGRAP